MDCGLGIRPELFDHVLQEKPALGFLEAHSENYFGDSFVRQKLMALREHYPISLHGVGLSLGRADSLDQRHLTSLVRLVDEVSPFLVSEHLAWSAYSHRHVPDLLPLPLTDQALAIMCQHIDQMQQALGRQILIENPSNYLLFRQLQISEPEFLNCLADRTGCGLLLDINNIYVSAVNVDRDPLAYLEEINSDSIKQYHLAGYTEVQQSRGGAVEKLLIDTHDHPVHQPVWDLFSKALSLHGAKPTLFEWDSDFPEFDVLLSECTKADQKLSLAPEIGCGSRAQEKSPFANNQGDELAVLQSQFLDDVFDLSPAHDLVVGEQRHRIGVYQNNLFGAMQAYFSEVFPATKGVVGDGFFKQMVQVTVQKSPPGQGDIHLYGEEMVLVISHFAGLSTLPYLEGLIRFEWAMHKAYYSESGKVLDVGARSQDELLAIPIALNQSVSIVESPYPLWEIHRQSLPDYVGEVGVSLDQGQEAMVVFKAKNVVSKERLSEGLLSTLHQIQKSRNLMQAIEVLSGSIEPSDLSSYLGFVLENQLLVEI